MSPGLDAGVGRQPIVIFLVFCEFSTVCFTVCLCISPDLDRNGGTKNETLCPGFAGQKLFMWRVTLVGGRPEGPREVAG
jgi:hypothetical protein